MSDRLTPEREAEITAHLAATTNWSLGNLAARDLVAELDAVRAERDQAQARVVELERTSVPNEVEYGIRMPGSQDVWPRKEFRSGHWEKVLANGAVLLQRVIRRGPWTETPTECPGFESNPVAPDLCAGCGDARRWHKEAAR